MIGGIVNMGLIMISGSVIPPPEGVDVANMESLAANIDRFQPRHFIMPFLAHALGTLAGAFLAVKIADGHKMKYAIAVSLFFLIGGLVNAFMLPAPTWFLVLDIAIAYIPMGWLGGKLAE